MNSVFLEWARSLQSPGNGSRATFEQMTLAPINGPQSGHQLTIYDQ